MARSVRSMPLYRSEEDYEIFFKMIRKTMEKYPFIIHSYCLMTTHFHMLITTMHDEIWKIMNRLMPKGVVTEHDLELIRDNAEEALEKGKIILDECRKQDIHILKYGDLAFYENIRDNTDFPILFYYKGRIQDNWTCVWRFER